MLDSHASKASLTIFHSQVFYTDKGPRKKAVAEHGTFGVRALPVWIFFSSVLFLWQGR